MIINELKVVCETVLPTRSETSDIQDAEIHKYTIIFFTFTHRNMKVQKRVSIEFGTINI
jgi:hypothetical protein